MAELNWTDLDQRAVDVGRTLAADAVQKVGNGHPGTAISLSPLAYTLFQKVMRHDPSDTHWVGRDRFTIAHELGHLTLHQNSLINYSGQEVFFRHNHGPEKYDIKETSI